MAECVNDPDKHFYIDFSYGDPLPPPQMTRRKMDDLFKPIQLSDDEKSREIIALEQELWAGELRKLLRKRRTHLALALET